MDNTILIYLIKVSVALALFYGLYILCLRKDTFLKLRRIYFLCAILFSLLFPLITLEMSATHNAPVQIPSYWLSEIEVGDVVEAKMPMNIWNVLLAILALVSVFCATRFIVQFFSLVRLRIANETEKRSVYRIVRIKDKQMSPFSFFNWIFVNSETHNSTELAEIIAHEQVHVLQYHSIDVVLSEILCICFWWNPFAWLLKKDMKLNLEYLADKGVLQSGFDSKEYQHILLQVSNRNTGIPIINNFNVSQLKKRITMMNKKKSSIFTSIKYLLVVPAGLALLLGNAVQATTSLDDFSIEEISQVMDSQQKPQKKGDTYTIVEQMPSYTGGLQAQQLFIANNIKYPIEAMKNGIQGKVIVRFIVKSTGEVSDVTVIRGVDPQLDEEAIRVVKSMPKWEPGKQNGKSVDVYYTLPIIFKLSGSGKVSINGDSNEKDKLFETEAVSLKEVSQSNEMKALRKAEQMPSFPGGSGAMQEFIHNNLKYPKEAQDAGIQGRVFVRFIVKSTGDISDVSIIREVDPELDKEALRMIKSMPKWKPGKQNGETVDIYYTLPITFKLQQ